MHTHIVVSTNITTCTYTVPAGSVFKGITLVTPGSSLFCSKIS